MLIQGAQSQSILLVEDNVNLLFALSALLETEGYRVRTAKAGAEALDLCATQELPNLIILDVSLPGIDGYEVCRSLKANPKTSKIPVLFMSALSATKDKVRGFEVGGVDYISKPFQVEEVFARVKTHLELQALNQALAAANLFNQQIISSAGEGVVVYGRDLRVQLWNPFMEKMTGVSAVEVLGQHPGEVFPALVSAGIIARFERILNGEAVEELDFQWRLPNGKVLWVAASCEPLLSVNGETLGVIGEMRNISERKRNEAELEEVRAQFALSSRLAGLGVLGSGVAHEINNPLAIVSGNLRLLARESDARAKALIEKADNAVTRIANIVRSLQTYAQAGSSGLEIVDMVEVVKKTLNLITPLLQKDGITVELSSVTKVAHVKGNLSKLQQVVLSLLSNSCDALIQGGAGGAPKSIALEFKAEAIESKDGGEHLILSVRDNGHGIKPEVLPRIFEPFFTTKDPGKGVGLGLSICHGIVTSHGGSIWAESEPGRGATFHFSLPTCKC